MTTQQMDKYVKILALSTIILTSSTVIAQLNSFNLYGISGVRVHRDELILPDQTNVRYTTPFIGIGIDHDTYPFTIEYYRASTYDLRGINYPLLEAAQYTELNYLDVIWRKSLFKKIKIHPGIGYFNYLRQNLASSFVAGSLGSSSRLHGYSLTGNLYAGNLRVQLRFEQVLHPFDYLTVLEREHRPVSFIYTFRFNKEEREVSTDSFIKGYFLLGLRGLPVTYEPKSSIEAYNWIGLSPQIGVEFLIPKFGVSFNLEKDLWIKPTAGNSSYRLLGYISTSIVGFRYHWKRTEQRTIKFGMGAAFLIDARRRIEQQLNNDEDYLNHYNVKGIGVSISYPLYRNLDLEMRQVFSIYGEEVFNPMRFSFGAIYRMRKFDY